jgi:[protein-PII] uridylyltransferase
VRGEKNAPRPTGATFPIALPQSERALAFAEQHFQTKGNHDLRELQKVYEKFLKIENHRLRLKHYSGKGGREICTQRAGLVDLVVRHLMENLSAAGKVDLARGGEGRRKSDVPRLAVVANGGYGRGELNPYSDLDIMFLHPDSLKQNQVEEKLGAAIHQILVTLWDVGFKVGHSVRSISEAMREANANMLSKTSLLEARLVTGDADLFHEFQAEFVKRCVIGHEEQYINDRMQNQAERHEKYGHTVYMQEPNVKNGCGGLRDYQNLLWMAYFKERVQTTSGLLEKKLLNESERRQLDRAYDFLLRVRTELHYMNKRNADVIVLSQQLHIADQLNYPQKNILRRSEAFMRDYYNHARNIYNLTELLSERLCLNRQNGRKTRSRLFSFLSRPKPVEKFDGFYASDGRVYAEDNHVFNQEPVRLLRLFQHMQQRELVLSPELKMLVRRRLHLIDKTFQYSKAAREIFMAILSQKGRVGAILRAMHDVDLLGRFIPEFGQLTCLVQHEFFHRYTADEHTLVCIEKLDQVIDTTAEKLSSYRALFQKLEDPTVLYLALLLHDTGKASNARHHAEASTVFANKVAARLQLPPEKRKVLLFLVDHHITLSNIARLRNLDDPATIAEFASLVRTQSNLDALMLLTLADGQGTGDMNWSDWKETLVWQLHHNTSLFLADGEAYARRRQIEREDLHSEVSSRMAPEFQDEIDAHFHGMPDRYFQTHAVEEIVEHIKLFRDFLRNHIDGEPLAPAVRWVAQPNKGHSEFWFCGWNRTQLAARIAGSLSVAQLNILSADVFTRADDLVFDVFRVCNTTFQAVTDEKDKAQVEKKLKQSLAVESFDFMPLLEKALKRKGYHLSQEIEFPTRIMVDNETHPVYTLVDIQTPDRLGLLYNLLRAFSEAGIQIALSRITTEKGAAIDSFYVTDLEGRKIRGSANLVKIQQALWQASQIHAPALR